MKFIDFFSGIGGFRAGMEMAGHECLGHCEIDKYANMSYQAMHLLCSDELSALEKMGIKQAQQYMKNWKGNEWYQQDVTTIQANEIPKADCWCFGFPCQDISAAGKGAGFNGRRSSLFYAITKIIRELEEKDRPTFLFIENVKNLLSVNGGFDFAKLLIELDEIGYDAEWQIINSKCFRVPQNRERHFIIGHLRGRDTPKVFPIPGANGKTGGKVKIIAHRKGFRRNLQVFDTSGICETLDTAQGGGRGPHIMCCGRVHKGMSGKVYHSKGISPTVTTNGDIKVIITVKSTGEQHKTIARRLTPKECFRLQAFTDEQFRRASLVNSNSQLYKQAGNSVTVSVIYEIAKRLQL